MSEGEYPRAIERHYATNWAEPRARRAWHRGPVTRLPPEFCVLLIQRSSEMIAYATRCMSQPEDLERLELHILTKSAQSCDDALVETLTAVAHYHRTERPLKLGESVNFGRPWTDGSSCTRGLISLPYLDGPKLEWLPEPKIRFLWLIPVTEAEIDFKKIHRVDALERRFEEAAYDYLDPLRASVV
jgi:hypothetical protein